MRAVGCFQRGREGDGEGDGEGEWKGEGKGNGSYVLQISYIYLDMKHTQYFAKR